MTLSPLISAADAAEGLQLLQPLEAVKDGAAANPPRSPEHEGPDCADLQDDADEASCTKQLLHKPQVTCTERSSKQRVSRLSEQLQEGSRDTLGALTGSIIHATVSKLLQDPASASSSQQVELDAVLNPSGMLSLDGLGVGLLRVGQALVVGLEQQAAASTNNSSTGGGSSSVSVPLLLRVLLVQRVGLCGNGVCEVGERALLNAEGGVLQEADAPCPQVGGVGLWHEVQHSTYMASTHGCSPKLLVV
jgi:hypothetical protein